VMGWRESSTNLLWKRSTHFVTRDCASVGKPSTGQN